MKRMMILIGLLILLGCTTQEIDNEPNTTNTTNETIRFKIINDTNCYNRTTLELGDFCRDINMTSYQDSYNRWGCIDQNDEIHTYRIEYNETLKGWLIGRKLYKGDTTCI